MCRKLPKNSGSSQSHAGAVRRRVCQLVAIRLARSNTIGSVTMKDYIATSILRNLRIFCVLTILLGAPAAFAEEADSGPPLNRPRGRGGGVEGPGHPKYKSRHPTYKSRHPKYKSRHPE